MSVIAYRQVNNIRFTKKDRDNSFGLSMTPLNESHDVLYAICNGIDDIELEEYFNLSMFVISPRLDTKKKEQESLISLKLNDVIEKFRGYEDRIPRVFKIFMFFLILSKNDDLKRWITSIENKDRKRVATNQNIANPFFVKLNIIASSYADSKCNVVEFVNFICYCYNKEYNNYLKSIINHQESEEIDSIERT